MYKLVLSKKVEKILADFQKTNSQLFNQFIDALDKIEENPYCAKALTGNLKGYYSYRVRNYRIIFEIEKHLLIVYIEKIEHRKEVYK
ncbi:MAG: type II toxin-antitoxin system RelE/ParE family toxin [bacterium]